MLQGNQEEAIYEVLKSYIKDSKPVRFDGNGYSDEWKEEAAKRTGFESFICFFRFSRHLFFGFPCGTKKAFLLHYKIASASSATAGN